MSKKEMKEGAVCRPSRWMLLKAKLKNVSPEGFKKIMDADTEYVLIDTRTAKEYEQLHLRAAINIDYLDADMWQQVEELRRDTTYLLYCRSGRRSTRLGTLMRNSGFDNDRIINLEGGIVAWQEKFGEEYIMKKDSQ